MKKITKATIKPEEVRVASLSDFVEKVGDAVRPLPLSRAYWRGQLVGEKLLPFAFRCKGDKVAKSKRETSQLLDFQHIAPARDSGCPGKDDRLEWLALMQHNGLPTRLLDWSESPLVAAFFAVERKGNDSAVWMLNPESLNREISGENLVYPVRNEAVADAANAAFSTREPHLSGDVLALAPCHFYPQQAGQQSCFTIHGNDGPLESHSKAWKFLKKFVIPAKAKQGIQRRLIELSVRRHHLFLDLRSLAEEIRERHAEAAGTGD